MDVRKIYDNAFQSLKVHEELARAFEKMGFIIEDGDGVISDVVFGQMSRDITTITECLGLHEKVEKVTLLDGVCPFDLSVFYDSDDNMDTSITADDLYNIIIFADSNEIVKDLLWRIFIEHDMDAVKHIQALNNNVHFGPVKD